MNIDELTIGQAKELAAMFQTNANIETVGLNSMIGKNVIVRTFSAGVWFGSLTEKSGNEVILQSGRRMWQWKAEKGISLSACAIYGIDRNRSKIVEPVESVWLEAIEIIPCTEKARESLMRADCVKAE